MECFFKKILRNTLLIGLIFINAVPRSIANEKEDLECSGIFSEHSTDSSKLKPSSALQILRQRILPGIRLTGEPDHSEVSFYPTKEHDELWRQKFAGRIALVEKLAEQNAPPMNVFHREVKLVLDGENEQPKFIPDHSMKIFEEQANRLERIKAARDQRSIKISRIAGAIVITSFYLAVSAAEFERGNSTPFTTYLPLFGVGGIFLDSLIKETHVSDFEDESQTKKYWSEVPQRIENLVIHHLASGQASGWTYFGLNLYGPVIADIAVLWRKFDEHTKIEFFMLTNKP